MRKLREFIVFNEYHPNVKYPSLNGRTTDIGPLRVQMSGWVGREIYSARWQVSYLPQVLTQVHTKHSRKSRVWQKNNLWLQLDGYHSEYSQMKIILQRIVDSGVEYVYNSTLKMRKFSIF